MLRTIASIAAVVTALATPWIASGAPSVSSLGSSGAMGMNSSGTLVVASNGNALRRYSFSPSGITFVDTPVDNGSGNASFRCSDDGLIITGIRSNADSLYPTLPTNVYTAAYIDFGAGSPAWTPIPTIANPGKCDASASQTSDVSRNGRFIIGNTYQGGTCSFFRPFLVDRVLNTITILPAQTGSLKPSVAFSISDDGGVIVGYDTNPNPFVTGTSPQPVAWVRTGGPGGAYTKTALPTTNATPLGIAYSVSADGTKIVGWSNDATNVRNIGLWTSNGAGGWTLTNLGRPNGTSQTQLISGDGTTIISNNTNAGGFWFWTQAGGWRDMAAYLTTNNIAGAATFSVYQSCTALSFDGLKFTGGTFGTPFQSWFIDLSPSGLCYPATLVPNSSSPASYSRCTGSIVLNAQAAGTGPFTYSWTQDGNVVTDGVKADGSRVVNSATSQLVIQWPLLGAAGVYVCNITGACGTQSLTVRNMQPDATYATPASNDTCAGATNIGEGTFSFKFCNAWNDEVTTSPAVNIATFAVTGDLWFRYTPTFTGIARISTCAGGNLFLDSAVTIYDDCGGNVVAANDDAQGGTRGCVSGRSLIPNFQVTQGVPVLIQVAGLHTNTSVFSDNIFNMQIWKDNDNCANAIPAVNGANPFQLWDATPDGAGPAALASQDIWFTYTPASAGRIRVSTCGVGFNSTLSILDTCAGNVLAENDNVDASFCGGSAGTTIEQAVIDNFAVNAGVPYIIRLGGGSLNQLGTGAGNMVITFTGNGCNPADIATLGTGLGAGGTRNPDGANTVDDLIAFLNAFFSGNNAAADFVTVGGSPNPDGNLTADDLIYFLSQFFSPCQ